MNKVFKVIWSEARNAYVVVSEIAKNHGSKSCSTKKLLAMLIATGVMTCASVAPAMAANPAPNDTKIEVGKGASAVKDSVAIGSGASVVAGNNGSGGVALGVGSVADRANAVSVGNAKLNRQITNVAKGTEDTDAVNVSQLKDVKAEALKHSTVTNGDNNITVTEGFNKDGGKEYNVALKNDIYLEGDDPNAFVSISAAKALSGQAAK